ncbi:unnamed protein product [Triticum aestivum]|uniref:Cytochrome P450 n=4 Tax=Triticinae TaxID=1648030 RepID=A0A9R1EN95_WHEAT|nr:desmethyl-deoxy-podophyllotoxin synthase-like [Triticum aestivum]KAF7013493.1 hypothetical protein CFC21_027574 [Triticum aestivum]SPT15887.1 unnamed protein product [Triticum aestivum]
MDASHPSYLLFLAILVFIPLAYFTLSARRQAGLRLPPGPWALPIIGHLHHMMGKLPHHRLRDLAQRHGPLMLLRLGGLPLVVASSAEAAHEVMRTHDIVFATRPISRTMKLILVDGSEGLIFAPYGSAWRQLRKICTVELLSARRVQSFRGIREQEVQHLLQAVASTPSPSAVNLGTLLSTYVNDSTVRAIIGSRFKDRETFLRLMEEGIELFSRPGLPDLYPSSRLAMLVSRMPRRMKRQSQAMMAFMETVIQEHRVPRAACDKEEDLVDVLLRIQNQDDHLEFPLTTDNIKAVMADIFIAGSETSATMLEWSMAELMKNPRVMQKVQEEVRRVLKGQATVTEESLRSLNYLHLVIKETLRLHPPVPLLLPRECGAPCQILGCDLPVGATVLVNVWAISRDSMHWDRPEEFMPERFEVNNIDFKGVDFEYTPFGAGRRMCPGMTFGLANMELALASLLYHFDWELPHGMAPTDLDMTEVLRVVSKRKDAFLVVPIICMPI